MSRTKIEQDNDVTDLTWEIYVEIETELLWSIGQGADVMKAR